MAVQRLLVVLDPPLKTLLKEIARRNKVSMSALGRTLIEEALEIKEDLYWDKVASERERNFDWRKGLSHKKVWGK